MVNSTLAIPILFNRSYISVHYRTSVLPAVPSLYHHSLETAYSLSKLFTALIIPNVLFVYLDNIHSYLTVTYCNLMLCTALILSPNATSLYPKLPSQFFHQRYLLNLMLTSFPSVPYCTLIVSLLYPNCVPTIS